MRFQDLPALAARGLTKGRSAVRKWHIIFLLILLLLSVSLEIAVFMLDTEHSFTDETISLLDDDSYTLSTNHYRVNGMEYVPDGNDPQLTVSGINQTVRTLWISFSSRLDADAAVQVFYREAGQAFSQESSLFGLVLSKNANEMILSLPEGSYEAIRIDIDGSFDLQDIRISEGEYSGKALLLVQSFSFLQTMILFIGLILVFSLYVHAFYGKKHERSLTRWETVFLTVLFLFYAAWAVAKPFNYAPDEAMRYDVTLFLFNHNRLPVGDELLSGWGFSYAHLPAVLCNQLGYVLMKIASVFTADEHVLLIAARFVSVFCATAAIYFVIKCTKLLFRPAIGWTVVFLIAFMPQYAFLSSYVNNDIVAFLGITMIAYAWLLGWRLGWRLRYALLLSLGIAVCALSYYNSYAWILLSVFFCIFTYLKQSPKDVKGLFRLIGFVACIVLLLAGYNFIRHLVLYGDLLGIETSHYYGELYAIESLKPSVRQSLAERGISLWDMLFGSHHWTQITAKSFVAVFGYMAYYTNTSVYVLVGIFLLVGMVGAAVKLITVLVKKRAVPASTWMFYLSLLACAVITVCLSVRNSYVTDFQPQGRYCYPAFLAIAIFFGKGCETLLGYIRAQEHRSILCTVFCTLMLSVCLYTFGTVYLPT